MPLTDFVFLGLKALHFADVKDHNLPLFTNLKCLQLGFYIDSHWDKVMLALLNRSPILETLVFPNVCTYFNSLIKYLSLFYTIWSKYLIKIAGIGSCFEVSSVIGVGRKVFQGS